MFLFDFITIYTHCFDAFIHHKVKDRDLSSNQQYKPMMNEFHEFYNDALNEIKRKIDRRHLQIDDVITENKNNDVNVEDFSDFSDLLLRWRQINDRNKQSVVEFPDFGCPTSQCIPSKRVQFIMSIYREYVLDKYLHKAKANHDEKEIDLEFFMIFDSLCGDSYTATQLIDDYHHIIDNHLTKKEDYERYHDCQCHDKDYQTGLNSLSEPYCCHKLFEERDADRKAFNVKCNDDNPNKHSKIYGYINTLDVKQLNIINICSKVHTRFNHSIFHHKDETEGREADGDGNGKFGKNPKVRSLNWRNDVKNNDHLKGEFSKFMNEDGNELDEEIEDEPIGSSDEIFDILRVNGYSSVDAVTFMKELRSEQYDTDAIMMDIIDDDHHTEQLSNSNIFVMLKRNKDIVKQMMVHFNLYYEDTPVFRQGEYPFYHWKAFQDDARYVSSPKYTSLKQESLQNQIFSIEVDVWHEIVHKTYLYSKSNKVRRIMAGDLGITNMEYEIPVNLALSASHLNAMMMYTNLTELQYYYKKYCCQS